VTIGDADFRKSPMEMFIGKLSKTAALPVTCHVDQTQHHQGLKRFP
jgi:hypothetical protein